MELKNQSAFYFPLANGRYEVNAGFKRLDTDFGNGPIDQQIFQFDNTFQRYRDNKLECRRENMSKYYQEYNFSEETNNTICKHLVSQLCSEHADIFNKTESESHVSLTCKLTGEVLNFTSDYQLSNTREPVSNISYLSALDAITCQLQEDLAVVQLNGTNDYISALHLCNPNHWAAEDKIGTSFFETHRPVPHIDKISQQSHSLLNAILDKGPYVRFAWGLSTDTQLNHHPQPPKGIDVAKWQGRKFDPDDPTLWLRVERQTLTGFISVNAILFTIRTYFYDITGRQTDSLKIKMLISAIESMSSKSIEYKGLQQTKYDILNWLHSKS